jgi:23S rRNA (guanosine2251-2'-O)-methyltransferase
LHGFASDNSRMSNPKVLFGFHAVGVRLKTAPQSVIEIYADPSRRDARMRAFVDRVTQAGVRLLEADGVRLARLCGNHGHQGGGGTGTRDPAGDFPGRAAGSAGSFSKR